MIDRIVLFGATGDLTARLLLPSLAVLLQDGKVPPDLTVLGLARSQHDREWFRADMTAALERHAAGVDPLVRERLVQALEYRTTDVTAPEDVREALRGLDRPALLYLALAPHLFEPTLLAIASAGIPHGSAIAVEKPFGDSLASAVHLNALLREHFPTTTVFRVDHFLSDGLVQQVVALRFANRFFEPLWNNEHIERVDIVWDETLTLEGRAAYYDTAGALKDMLQNHLLEVLAILAMDQPARLDEPSFRDARVAVLRAIPAMSWEEVRQRTIRGRYVAGDIQGRAVPAYVNEPGIDPAREHRDLRAGHAGGGQLALGRGALHAEVGEGPGRGPRRGGGHLQGSTRRRPPDPGSAVQRAAHGLDEALGALVGQPVGKRLRHPHRRT